MTSAKPTIVEALAAVMSEVSAVKKEDRNEAQRFMFRGIDAVVNAVAPALRKHGVIVMPTLLDYQYQTVEVGKNRTQMAHVIVRVRYVFSGPAGDAMCSEVIGEAMDSGDKAVAKAMSVAFRIALLQSLALPTDEPDPDSHSYERSAAAEPKPPADEETLMSLQAGMTEVDTVEALNALAQKAAGLDLPDDWREGLRNLYLTRKKELQQS